MKTVLIIDDSRISQMAFKTALSKEGYNILTASNGIEGLKSAQGDQRPDLILLDMHMPEMSGIEFLKKAQEINLGIPVLLVTADVTQETMDMSRSLGALAVIPKSFLGINVEALEWARKIFNNPPAPNER